MVMMAPERRALTPTQTTVLRLALQGMTNNQVAAELGVSVNTAKAHLAACRDRLGLDDGVKGRWLLRAAYALGHAEGTAGVRSKPVRLNPKDEADTEN